MRWAYFLALFRTYAATEAEIQQVRTRGFASTFDTNFRALANEAKLIISSLESKSGTLLTHISMMIAITGLMLAVSNDSHWYEVVLTAELVCYLILALLCIRCQFHFDTHELMRRTDDGKEPAPHHYYQTVLFGEQLYREGLFRFVQRSLYLLTFCLIVTVTYGLLADEIGLLSGDTQ